MLRLGHRLHRASKKQVTCGWWATLMGDDCICKTVSVPSVPGTLIEHPIRQLTAI